MLEQIQRLEEKIRELKEDNSYIRSALREYKERANAYELRTHELNNENDELRADNQHLISLLREQGVMLSEDGIHDGG